MQRSPMRCIIFHLLLSPLFNVPVYHIHNVSFCGESKCMIPLHLASISAWIIWHHSVGILLDYQIRFLVNFLIGWAMGAQQQATSPFQPVSLRPPAMPSSHPIVPVGFLFHKDPCLLSGIWEGLSLVWMLIACQKVTSYPGHRCRIRKQSILFRIQLKKPNWRTNCHEYLPTLKNWPSHLSTLVGLVWQTTRTYCTQIFLMMILIT